MQYYTSQSNPTVHCDICGCDHVFGHATTTVCVQALKARVAALIAKNAEYENGRWYSQESMAAACKYRDDQIAALTAERDLARKALSRLWELTPVAEYTLEDMALIQSALEAKE